MWVDRDYNLLILKCNVGVQMLYSKKYILTLYQTTIFWTKPETQSINFADDNSKVVKMMVCL